MALVFGPEQAGLSNPELDLCDATVEIPTSTDLSSLNVAAAVQVACYELRMATIAISPVPPRANPAKAEIRALLAHTDQVLTTIEAARSPLMHNRMLKRLTLLLSRSDPDRSDVRMLRGILAKIEKSARPSVSQARRK